jgi:hypothetical protein
MVPSGVGVYFMMLSVYSLYDIGIIPIVLCKMFNN